MCRAAKCNARVEVFYGDRNRTAIHSSHVRDEDFQRVKVQLRALSLIREAGKASAWTLAPSGDRQTMQVAAIRSSHAPGLPGNSSLTSATPKR